MLDDLHDADVAIGVARKLAESAARYKAPDNSDLIQAARMAVLDTVGCMIAGAQEEATIGVATLSHNLPGYCTIFGRGTTCSAPDAALINGTSAHALDFDDACTTVLGHTSAVLVPALISLAEAENLSGAALVDAFIVGVEVQDRLGRIFNPEHYAAGWHSTSTLCTLGAAAGCAHLLGLGADGILGAISNGFSAAGGSKKQIGSPLKPIHAGLAARAAVEAALLARVGISGDEEPLAGVWGMLRQYGANPSAARVEQAIDNLQIGRALSDGVLQTKRFPSCAATHKTLDGVLRLRDEYNLDPACVALIETWVPADLAANLRYHHPATIGEARFSMAYCATRVLDTGGLSLSDFTTGALAQFGTPEALSKVRMFAVQNGDDPMGMPVRTKVTMTSGEQFETTVVHTHGGAECPLSSDETFQKFVNCCVFSGCSQEEARAWGALISALPEADGTRKVMAGLRLSTPE